MEPDDISYVSVGGIKAEMQWSCESDLHAKEEPQIATELVVHGLEHGCLHSYTQGVGDYFPTRMGRNSIFLHTGKSEDYKVASVSGSKYLWLPPWIGGRHESPVSIPPVSDWKRAQLHMKGASASINRFKFETLDDFLVVSVNGPSVSEFDPTAAIDKCYFSAER
uniref:Uncharacterized protein n=1 Tax=Timema poppense TaxID=170557 RepID=A0A7R9H596_TIMPO|nr:unnamed protein product [Timema poppensis]